MFLGLMYNWIMRSRSYFRSLKVICLLVQSQQAVREAATICPRTYDLDRLFLTVVSESRVTWSTSANFGLSRPLCSRLRPDVRDRQTSDSIIA